MQGVGTKGHEKVSPWEFKDKLGGLWATPGHVIGDIIAFGPRDLFLEWTYLSLIFSSVFLLYFLWGGGGYLSLFHSPYLPISQTHHLRAFYLGCFLWFFLLAPAFSKIGIAFLWEVPVHICLGKGSEFSRFWLLLDHHAFPSWPHNLQPSTSTNEKQTDNAFQTLCLYLHFNSDLSFVSTTSPKFTMTFKLKILSVW